MPGPRAKAEPHPRIIAADTLALENVTYDEYYVAQNPGVKPGRYVLVRITDTGSGIAAQVLPKIFDPWFTTKRAGQGTGLGLSTIRGIVTTHYGGGVAGESKPGQETSCSVHLPARRSRRSSGMSSGGAAAES